MSWSAYEIFSVISGGLLVIAAIVGTDLKPSERFWGFVGGLGFAGYGFYVANQTSGTYVFPVWIFILPVLALLYIGASLAEAVSSRSSGRPRNPLPPQTTNPNPAGQRSSPVDLPLARESGSSPSPPDGRSVTRCPWCDLAQLAPLGATVRCHRCHSPFEARADPKASHRVADAPGTGSPAHLEQPLGHAGSDAAPSARGEASAEPVPPGSNAAEPPWWQEGRAPHPTPDPWWLLPSQGAADPTSSVAGNLILAWCPWCDGRQQARLDAEVRCGSCGSPFRARPDPRSPHAGAATPQRPE